MKRYAVLFWVTENGHKGKREVFPPSLSLEAAIQIARTLITFGSEIWEVTDPVMGIGSRRLLWSHDKEGKV